MIRLSIALTILVSGFPAGAAEPSRSEADFAVNEAQASARISAPARERAKAEAKPAATSGADAAANGSLSVFSVSPSMPRRASAVALSGYDTAAGTFRARGSAEGRLLSFLAARVEYEHGPANGPSDRVALGLRATLLNQAAHGVDLGAIVQYQPRDFRQEGNVIGGLLLARRFDRLTLVINPLIGSDPEGDDRSFELRFASLYQTSSWLVLGLDSRGRYNLSNDQKRAGTWAVDWEAQAGGYGAVGVGPLVFTSLVGPSFLQRQHLGLDGASAKHELRPGLLAMVGVGGTF